MYQQSVEEYERRQKQLENMRQKEHSSLPISVGGEPLTSSDPRGNMVFNKMKKIDEDFDEIEFEVN